MGTFARRAASKPVMDRVGRLLLLLPIALAACARVTGSGTSASEVAEVICEPDGTRVATGSVRPRPDGVHLRIDNRRTGPVYVYHRQAGEIGNVQDVGPGVAEAVAEEGPGAWELICVAPNEYPADDGPWVGLEVVDPDGLWVQDRPDCEHPTGTHPDYLEDFEGGTPPGVVGDPVELAREDIPAQAIEVLPRDVLERAGYPEALPRLVRLVRDGRVLAVQRYASDGAGGWIDRGVDYCEV